MKKIFAILCLWSWGLAYSYAQITANPAIFTAEQQVTLTYDATQSQGQAVANLPTNVTSITAHIGAVIASSTSTTWTNVPGTWGDPSAAPKFTRQGTSNIYTLTTTSAGVRALFPALASTSTPIYRLAMVLRENGPCGNFAGNATACKEGKSSTGQDIYLDINQGGFDVSLTTSVPNNSFVTVGSSVNITATANQAGNLAIKVNGAQVASQNNATTLAHTLNIVAGTFGYQVEVSGVQGTGTPITKKANYVVKQTPVSQAVPNGVMDGINYSSTDASKATLVFTVPEKNYVYVVGDFNNWELRSEYLMRKTPNYGGSGANSNPANNKFWIELTGLTPQTEYAFQYWVYDANDNLVRVADPYCEKTLDPLDQYILPATFPNLKPYPAGQQGVVSVLETGQTLYAWSNATTNFVKPDKKRLNVYELWVQDFTERRDFQGVIDKLDYLQNLGINAIEFMPVMEFAGNLGWGYNPTFFCALDKTYGSKNKFKELVDKCHQRGIAVILDIALNHAEYEFPGCKMFWNSATNQPTSNSPWFNVSAPHPYSVFQDFNHNSPYTQAYADRVLKYWIQEYKIDGYRYDLVKGLTQTSATESSSNNYDGNRVTHVKRFADAQWAVDNQSYVILEFLATGGSEEAEYASYRVGENPSKGMMLWRNLETKYAQNLMGYDSNNSLGDIDFANNPNGSGVSFAHPHVMSYMESHDEERVMYKALQFGNTSNASHNVKNLNVALKRVEPAVLFHIPASGPKMIWQFGELGYDFSIFRCSNGTVSTTGGCRTDQKPIAFASPQNYDQVTERMNLYKFYAAVNQLKKKYDVFGTYDVFVYEGDFAGKAKQMLLTSQPYSGSPTDPNKANVVIVANFDVVSQTIATRFHHTGTWYSYFQNNATFNVTNTTAPTYQSITLGPGEYRFFTDVQMTNFMVVPDGSVSALGASVSNTVNVALAWTNPINNATGLRVLRRLVGSPNFVAVATVAPNATSFTDSGLAENTNYEYQIEAFNINGTTTSNIASITTGAFPPIAPSNLVLTNLTASVASLQWSDGSTDESGFVLQRKTGTGSYADLSTLLNANTISYNDNTIVSGNTYMYRVASVKGDLNTGARSYSNEIMVSTAVPDATPILATPTAGIDNMQLSWTDASTNETNYKVQRSATAGTGFADIVTLSSNTFSYTDTGLNSNTPYFYRVQASNIFGSTTSNEVNATTLTLNAPTNVVATSSNTARAVTVTWTDAANNETAYAVSRATSINGIYTDLTTNLPAGTTTYTDTDANLVTSGTYFYKVCAKLGALTSCTTSAGAVVTSAERNVLDKLITVAPNPTEGRVSVQFDAQKLKKAEMRLLDLRGKVIRIFPATTAEKTELNLKNLPKGVYLLELNTDKGLITKRVIKN